MIIMNIIILEKIFKRLNTIDAIYCCLLYPELINIKCNKSIYLYSKSCANFVLILNVIRYFYNFDFELLLNSPKYLDYNYCNLNNLRITLDFYDYDLILQKDNNDSYCKTLDISFNNLSGIKSLEFHIQGYYKIKDDRLDLKNIKSVIITSENPIRIINLNQVEKFVLNDGENLKTFNFDQHLKCLSIFKVTFEILLNLSSNHIKELLLNSSNFVKDINLKLLFPNINHLQLDFSTFCDEFRMSSLEGNFKTLSLNYTQKAPEDYSNFKNLKSLQLCGNKFIKKIIGFKGKNLFLDRCFNLQNFNFNNLDSLYLQFNPYITGKDTELLKNIKTLDLSGTNIEYLSDKINNLQIFIGQDCKYLQSFPYYKKIEILNLDNCINLKKINTLNINTLNIRGCISLKNLDQVNYNQIFTS